MVVVFVWLKIVAEDAEDEEEDLVHRAARAVATAGHVPVVADHQAVHVAHEAEASPVVDAPNQSHQRVAAAQNQSKYNHEYNC